MATAQRAPTQPGPDLNFRLPVHVDGAVVDHFHDGDAEVAPDPEGNAEAQPAHDGNDVPLGEAAALAVAERGALPGRGHGPPLLIQLHVICFLVGAIDFSAVGSARAEEEGQKERRTKCAVHKAESVPGKEKANTR